MSELRASGESGGDEGDDGDGDGIAEGGIFWTERRGVAIEPVVREALKATAFDDGETADVGFRGKKCPSLVIRESTL